MYMIKTAFLFYVLFCLINVLYYNMIDFSCNSLKPFKLKDFQNSLNI